MVTNQQVRRLKKMLSEGKKLYTSALKTEMDEKTARKYRDTGKLPSELKPEHTWKTRIDPFEDEWEEVSKMLATEPGLEALTIFKYLQREYPGKYQDGQLRTLQRKIKRWRATEGPPKEVMFPQEHHPGRLSQSDFTHMNALGITISKQPFDHLLYHFTLTKSNWETGSVCFSESFESLSDGLQNALWELGGVPEQHQTDCMSTAVNKDGNPEEFTQRYTALMDHYRMKPKKINPGEAHENGDVEQSHFRFKKAVDQEMMLRGSRDFADRAEYERFLRRLFKQRNSGRRKHLEIEKKSLRPLPEKKIDSFKELEKSVSRNSTILIDKNIYSIASRLIGETVKVKVFAEHLEVQYAQKLVETIPRLPYESR
jgi:transposase